MLRSTTGTDRLFLTADLRAVDALSLPTLESKAPGRLAAELRRFPPVEDVVAMLDRAAVRALVA